MNYPFYKIDDFPELIPIQESWEAIRDEAMEYIDSFYPIEDERNETGNWSFMPLKPATDDMDNHGDYLSDKVEEWKDKFGKTREICESIDNCGYSFSVLGPRGHIAPHSHGRNYVTAILGLDLEAPCKVRAAKKIEDFKQGEFTIFDFREEHEVWNFSNKNRLVMLLAIPNRHQKSGFLNYIKEKDESV